MPYVICIDPGHGGKDPGAIDSKGPGDNLITKEADINLQISLLLTALLRKHGYTVILTRASDWYPDLKTRYNRANQEKADVFISIHCNASANEKASGIECLYSTKNSQSKRLAELVQQEVIKVTKAANRGVRNRENLAVLNGTKMPSCLIEVGFITNTQEEYKLSTPVYRLQIAEAIMRAIERFKRGERP